MNKFTLAVMVGLGMLAAGCGSSGGSTYVTESEPVEVPADTNIVMTAGGDGELNYAYADDGSIVVGSDNGEINIVQGDGYIENTTTIAPAPVPVPDTNDTNAT